MSKMVTIFDIDLPKTASGSTVCPTSCQRKIRDTEETKRSVNVESAFTRKLLGPTRTQTDALANVRSETQQIPSAS